MPCERTSACCCCHRFPHPIGTSTLKGSAPKPHVRGCLGLLPASRRPAVYLDSDGGELGREALGRAILSSLGAVLLLFPFSLIVIPKASLWKLQNNGSAICACVAACALITGPRVPSLGGTAGESETWLILHCCFASLSSCHPSPQLSPFSKAWG